ncbi:MAG TPA: nitrilase-related carbon-nitrogen hydrolase [Candidatus Limnocylindrales bacterium]|nr:nitrilase-related carbon-nitrogen hydrolase [Candidatus Limnocylindrales bacterium]
MAAVQAAPVFLDRAATTRKAVELIERAGAEGAGLVAFGEGFLPGHPVWFHLHPITHPTSIALSTTLIDQAVTIPGPEADALADAATRTGAVVVLGVVERPDVRSSALYDSALVATPDGSVATRRKIVPAVGERIVFTAGAGEDIRTFDTPFGPLSVLLGGENTNPLLTAALRAMGARLHVACWPPHFNKPRLMPELMTITGRAVAYQNTAWVVSVAGATSEASIDRLATTDEQRALLEATTRDPASAVFAPRGAPFAGPQPGGDGILYADIDLAEGAWANLVNRHYDRPDLLRLVVDRSPRLTAMTFVREAPSEAPATDDGDADAAIRREIVDRFGDRLSSAEVDELVPYVRGIRATGDRLAALGLDAVEPEAPAATEPAERAADRNA